MANFDECCVLIPSATLEDFPTKTSDFDARNILAAWTVLWHPKLLATTAQLPTWYRADSPPEPDGPRVVVVPNLSLEQMPKGYDLKCKQNKDCHWVTGDDREQMLQDLNLDQMGDLQVGERTIGVKDFFAAGFASLQIQVMTRRLRYTSNLDEIHLQTRVVDAAKAFIDADAMAAAEALHDVFDCLSEERDHYFSSDPHLIDLNLLTPTLVQKFIDIELAGAKLDPAEVDEDGSVLPTPTNVLIDHEVASQLKDDDSPTAQRLKQTISSGQTGWAGGDPGTQVALDTLSLAGAEQAINDGQQVASEAVGTVPKVYARFSGFTPSDMTPTLVRLGYQGMIPTDFSQGTGFGEESKVICEFGGAVIHALTAKPIDAASDASFLDIGARLGEAIDSGEISTALLVHWPGQSCDSFQDLKRVASWGLALGKFWKLDDYFTQGEHPYHHGSASAVSPKSASILKTLSSDTKDPISTIAASCRESAQHQANARLAGMLALASGRDASSDVGIQRDNIAKAFAAASGAKASDSPTQTVLCVNEAQVGRRELVSLAGNPPDKAKHVYASSVAGRTSVSSVDIPAYGFSKVRCGNAAASGGSMWGRLFGGKKPIAETNALSNQFMEVAISGQSGGIQGLYSGQTRGNRFSSRLVFVAGDSDDSTMKATKTKVVESSEAIGKINVVGEILSANQKAVAEFELNYTLARGSRFLQIDGTITPHSELHGDPWENYFAHRAAVASESAIVRLIVRDKLHRSRSRRFVSPLGFVIDESERQTLVACHGYAFHRRTGDRFIDSLILVPGETQHQFSLTYGIDVPSPVANAKGQMLPALQVHIEDNNSLPDQGWIAHIAPADATIESLVVQKRQDGKLAAKVRIIQTRSKTATIRIRFCRDVNFATILEGPASSDDESWNLAAPKVEDDQPNTQPMGLSTKGDLVRCELNGHQVVDLLVVFEP